MSNPRFRRRILLGVFRWRVGGAQVFHVKHGLPDTISPFVLDSVCALEAKR